MQVLINKKRVNLSKQIGVGGEATIYEWKDKAVKIYHPISSLPAGQRRSARRNLKLKEQKILHFPSLPKRVLAPEDPVYIGKEFAGFTMGLLKDIDDVLKLSKKKWRTGNSISNSLVLDLFKQTKIIIKEIHKKAIIGDFNSSNLLFHLNNKHISPYFIDADSMQFGKYPCVVAHELFLDPFLYGKDLNSGPIFTRESDWYAFTVMLFMSMLRVHPYGGVHRPKNGKPLNTELRRAEAAYSIFNKDIIIPKAAIHYDILPDDVLHYLSQIFDKRERGEYPDKLLDFNIIQCSCGAEHSKKSCPICSKQVIVDPTKKYGKCTIRIVFETTGKIIKTDLQNRLKYVYEKDDKIYREDDSLVYNNPNKKGMKFSISGDDTWIGWDEKLIRTRNGKPSDMKNVGMAGSYPMFDSNSNSIYYIHNGWLKRNDSLVGQILDNQTWFKIGQRLGFGFYRVGLKPFYFIFSKEKGFKNIELDNINGRILEASFASNDNYVIFGISFEESGKTINRIYWIRDDGSIKGKLEGVPQDSRILQSVYGKLVHNGLMLTTSDEGILSVQTNGGMLEERNLFPDTEPFVESGDKILPGPNNSIYVIKEKKILQLSI